MNTRKALAGGALLLLCILCAPGCNKDESEAVQPPAQPTQTIFAQGEICLFLFTIGAPRPDRIDDLSYGMLGRPFQQVAKCPSGRVQWLCAPDRGQPMPAERVLFDARAITQGEAVQLCQAISRAFAFNTALVKVTETGTKEKAGGQTIHGGVIARFTPHAK